MFRFIGLRQLTLLTSAATNSNLPPLPQFEPCLLSLWTLQQLSLQLFWLSCLSYPQIQIFGLQSLQVQSVLNQMHPAVPLSLLFLAIWNGRRQEKEPSEQFLNNKFFTQTSDKCSSLSPVLPNHCSLKNLSQTPYRYPWVYWILILASFFFPFLDNIFHGTNTNITELNASFILLGFNSQ